MENIKFLAQKIHITEEMNELLLKMGGFKTEHRGLLDIKVIILKKLD